MTAAPRPDGGHYLAVMNLAAPGRIAVGALGEVDLPTGDLVYVGSAQRGLAARVARHRRTDKRPRWHVDSLRAATEWVEGRLLPGATGPECDLAEAVAALPGATRIVAGFGASDCRCAGHLVHLPAAAGPLPGVRDPAEGVEARFVARTNRFVARARLPSGAEVRAYVPNTARLTTLLTPEAAVLLQASADPTRSTRWTLSRVCDGGALVSLHASRATDLVEAWLRRGGEVPGLGAATAWRREVPCEGHRFDYRLTLADGRDAWLEVKSLSLAADGFARFSRTPSRRGAGHLATLGALAARGVATAATFVVQRHDVAALRADPGADPGWLAAVRSAAASGVAVGALRCRVTATGGWIDRAIPVTL